MNRLSKSFGLPRGRGSSVKVLGERSVKVSPYSRASAGGF